MIFEFFIRGGIFVTVVFLLQCCKPAVDGETKKANEKADSLSIKLNSPELKAINDELREDPNNPALYHKRAGIYLTLNQPQDAEGDAKRAIRLDSTKAEHWLALVDASFAQNKTRAAKEYLLRIEKIFPGNTEALLKLSELYFLVQNYQTALDYANKALKINPNLAQGYYIKGNIYKESGDTAKAVSSFETAIEQDNKFADPFTELGILYGAQKNPIAMDYYNNALKLNPSDKQVKYARAKLLQDIGKTDDAIAAYEHLIKEDQNCPTCYYNLGAIHLEIKKDNAKALDYFTKAIAANPNYAEAYFARGYTYALIKDKENAMADYKMCLQLMPNYEPAIQGMNRL